MDALADREERTAGSGGWAEVEEEGEGLVRGGVGKAEEGGGKGGIGVEGKGGELGREETEKESEGGFGEAEEERPAVIGGGGGGEKAVEPRMRWGERLGKRDGERGKEGVKG